MDNNSHRKNENVHRKKDKEDLESLNGLKSDAKNTEQEIFRSAEMIQQPITNSNGETKQKQNQSLQGPEPESELEPEDKNDLDELSLLPNTWSMDQSLLEQNVAHQATKALYARDISLDNKRLTKTLNLLTIQRKNIARLEQKLKSVNIRISEKEKVREEIRRIEDGEVRKLENDVREIRDRISEKEEAIKKQEETGTNDNNNNRAASGNGTTEVVPSAEEQTGKRLDESQHDYLVRIGKITPFSNTFMANKSVQSFDENEKLDNPKQGMSHQKLRIPGMELEEMSDEDEDMEIEDDLVVTKRAGSKRKADDSDYEFSSDSFDEDEEDENDSSDDDDYHLSDVETTSTRKTRLRSKPNSHKHQNKKKKATITKQQLEEIRDVDDGDINVYNIRLQNWTQKIISYRQKVYKKQGIEEPENEKNSTLEEWQKPHPVHKDFVLDSQFKLQGDIYTSLFDYQKTGVQWQWELYTQKVGGILSDEMGLGKTIQVVAFVAGLFYSGLLKRPALIVCPATVMKQWVNEFHRWCPALRVAILHSIGSGMGMKSNGEVDDDEILEEALENSENGDLSLASVKRMKGAQAMIDSIMKSGKLFLGSYG